ncbi:histidine kinase [uncultured Bacteroides sp.]|uniref:sensor histidine kinase n=1 Tax=uncultured Bacteroides sp. TaxID=162156 RepID=UPI00280BA2C9|nr:histidine kinase [uncultured Bacteroides sp.]
MKKVIRWLSPFFLGVVMFNFIRLVTDLPRNDDFWPHSKIQHIQALCIIVFFSYVLDYRMRITITKKLSQPKQYIFKEYLTLTAVLFLVQNLIMIIGSLTGFLIIGNGINDYIIANVICIPMYLLYYTIIRNDMIAARYHEQTLQLEKVKVGQLDMELKFLKSQYHPHFLFNALNTIYFQTEAGNTQARTSIELLSELLRYQLYDIQKTVTLKQEMNYTQAYIRFQQMRMSERLRLTQFYDEGVDNQEIHPLLFQPLVENAFKYVGGEYWINFRFELSGNEVIFRVENSLNWKGRPTKGKQGIGIENLKRRLNLLYPARYQLTITPADDVFTAELKIKL